MEYQMEKNKSDECVSYAFKISNDVISVGTDCTIRKAAGILTKNNIGVVLVKDGNGLAGILSERDIVQKVVSKGLDPASTPVSKIMTKDVVTADIDEGMGKIHAKLNSMKFRHLPIVKNGSVIGIVSNRDLIYLRELKLKAKDM